MLRKKPPQKQITTLRPGRWATASGRSVAVWQCTATFALGVPEGEDSSDTWLADGSHHAGLRSQRLVAWLGPLLQCPSCGRELERHGLSGCLEDWARRLGVDTVALAAHAPQLWYHTLQHAIRGASHSREVAA